MIGSCCWYRPALLSPIVMVMKVLVLIQTWLGKRFVKFVEQVLYWFCFEHYDENFEPEANIKLKIQ